MNILVALYEGRKAERDSTVNTFLQVQYCTYCSTSSKKLIKEILAKGKLFVG